MSSFYIGAPLIRERCEIALDFPEREVLFVVIIKINNITLFFRFFIVVFYIAQIAEYRFLAEKLYWPDLSGSAC